jgi:hypothetical protein
MSRSDEYYARAKKECEQVFEDKERRRKLDAQKPIEEKIRDLVRLQTIMVNANPELAKSGLMPWKLD